MSRSNLSSCSEEQCHQRLDALYSWWPYAEGSLKASIEALIEEVKRGEWDAERERQFFLYAEATWPARVATQLYAKEAQEHVWEEVTAFCLPTTHVLLERLAEREGHTRFFDIMRSPSADFSFFARERREFALLLPQIYAALWKKYRGEMKEALADAEQRLRTFKEQKGTAMPEKRAQFERALIYGELRLVE